MLEKPGRPEIESQVYVPFRGVTLTVGLVFALAPAGFALFIQFHAPTGFLHWLAWSIAAGLALLGGAVAVSALRNLLWPPRVRHASSDVLPDVPNEPVVFEGAIVQRGRTHELVEDAAGWEFRPLPSLRRGDLLFVLIFGIPFLAIFAAVASWAFHSQNNAPSWPYSILVGTFLTLLCGGSALFVFVLMLRAAYRQLSRLRIPRSGDPLELDLGGLPDPGKTDLASGLNWFIGKDDKRKRLSIPRELLRAVQLCPWKFVVGNDRGTSTTWAVQGLLVVEGSSAGQYLRLPFVLSGDFAGTARLMQQLAETLQVPYLFGADENGWQAETCRAETRPPLKMGGM